MVNNKSESREEQITRCGLSVGGMLVIPHNTRFRELNMRRNVKIQILFEILYFEAQKLFKNLPLRLTQLMG